MTATLGDFYGSAAGKHGTTATFGYGPELVLTANGNVIYRERFAFVQDDLDAFALG